MIKPELIRHIEKSERNLASHSVWRPEIRKKLHQKPVRRRPDLIMRNLNRVLNILADALKEDTT